MVPLLLGFLGANEYLVWAVFTTIGGLTLQLEFAIQTLMVRRVAPLVAAGDLSRYRKEMARARRSYGILSMVVLTTVLPLGGIYMHLLFSGGGHSAPLGWEIAWVAFAGAYALNYLFGPNNVLLLATGRTDGYFWISTTSRLLNFVTSLVALVLGSGLLGISMSFLLAVLANVAALLLLAKSVRAQIGKTLTPTAPLASWIVPSDDFGLARYTLFTLSAFLLYRGAFLLAFGAFATQEAAAYGLALQAFAIMASVAVIPIHVRLHVIVEALRAGDLSAQNREIFRSLGFATAAMLAGGVTFAMFGPWLLHLIGSDVELPPSGLIALMTVAFFVEAIILILGNPMLVERDLSFVRTYVGIAALGLVGAASAVVAGAPLGLAMVALPLALQACLSLPLIFRRLAMSRGCSSRQLLADLVKAAPAAFGRS